MIEEINTEQYVTHYFQKVLGELGGDTERFLKAAIDFAKAEAKCDVVGTVKKLLGLQLTNAAAPAPAACTLQPAPAAAAAAAAVAAAAAPAPAKEDAPASQQAQPQSNEAAEAAAAAPAEQAQQQQQQQQQQEAGEVEGEAAEEGEKGPGGLKPNNGNGADLDRYSWTQTLQECVVSVPVPPGTKGRMCEVQISRNRLKLGVKGQPPVLDGELFAAVKPDDCLWNVVDSKLLEVTLQKADSMQWWRSVVKGEPEIDTQAVEPESSKLGDLDPEMRATVEKMMYDQRQKALGLPTSEEQHKQEVLNKFMAAHPEMDFSNAKFM